MEWDSSEEAIAKLRHSIQPISIDLPLKEILAEHFPKDCADLPISGGWGYTMAQAIVFEQREKAPPWERDFVGLEYHIAQKIIYEELIIFRPKEARFSGIDLKLNTQGMTIANERKFDCLNFAVTCWSDVHWDFLKSEWERNDFGRRTGFDIEGHTAKRAAAKIEFERQFWFDITNVFAST